MDLVNKINDVAFHVNNEYALVLDDRPRTTYNATLEYHGNVDESRDDPKLKLLAFSIPKKQGGKDYFTVKYNDDAFFILNRAGRSFGKLLDIIPIPRLTSRSRSQERAAHGRDGRGGSRKRKTARKRRWSRR